MLSNAFVGLNSLMGFVFAFIAVGAVVILYLADRKVEKNRPVNQQDDTEQK